MHTGIYEMLALIILYATQIFLIVSSNILKVNNYVSIATGQ